MKKSFSAAWTRSSQPRKQRKFRLNAPLHIKQRFVRARLSKDLSEQNGRRNSAVRTGDTVRIMRGQFKGKSGKVESVSLKDQKVIISGIDFTKKDGSKALYPIHASNLIIESLALDDAKRKAKLGKSVKKNDKKSS